MAYFYTIFRNYHHETLDFSELIIMRDTALLTDEDLDMQCGELNWARTDEIRGADLYAQAASTGGELIHYQPKSDIDGIEGIQTNDWSSPEHVQNSVTQVLDAEFIHHGNLYNDDVAANIGINTPIYHTALQTVKYGGIDCVIDSLIMDGVHAQNNSNNAMSPVDTDAALMLKCKNIVDSILLLGIDATALNKAKDLYVTANDYGHGRYLKDIAIIDTTGMGMDTQAIYDVAKPLLDAVVQTLPSNELSTYATDIKTAYNAALAVTGDLEALRLALPSVIVGDDYNMAIATVNAGKHWGYDKLGQQNTDASNPV